MQRGRRGRGRPRVQGALDLVDDGGDADDNDNDDNDNDGEVPLIVISEKWRY